MKRQGFAALLALGLLLVSACAGAGGASQPGNPDTLDNISIQEPQSQGAGYQEISPQQAWDKMQELEQYVLLDVRTQEEFDQAHIEGALLLPDYELAEKAEQLLPDKDAVLLVYCRSGRRSENAARTLIGMGYTQVYDFGGIIDWPYETVGGQ